MTPETPGQDGMLKTSPISISASPPSLPSDELVDAILMSIDDKHSDPTVVPMGFRNGPPPHSPRNVCYRNGTMTMLLNLPFFCNWLAKNYTPTDAMGTPVTLMDCIQQLARDYWGPGGPVDGKGNGRITPKRKILDTAMDRFFGNFLGQTNFTPRPQRKNLFLQEDAADFLATTLNTALAELPDGS
jgi:hypothetical protein